MCNDKRGSSMHQAIHTILHDLLCTGVNGTGCFIQDQNRRIRNGCPCNGDQLPLSLTQASSVSCQYRIITVWKSSDKSICIDQFCCPDDFFIRCIQFTEPDIFFHRSGKQMCILQHNSKGTSQIRLADLGNINSVIADLSLLNIIESIDQIGNGRFSGSGGSHKGNLLPRLCIKVHIMEHDLLRVISKVYIFKDHIPFQLDIIYAVICLMYMFPCPSSGSFFTFCECSVFLFRIDQCDITFVFLFFFIHQTEDTVCPCHRHNDRIQLHTNLVDRHTETFVKSQETCKSSQRKAADSVKSQGSTYHSADHITDISKLCI